MFQHIKTGLHSSLKCWRWVVAFWLVSALTVSLIFFPLKTSVKKILGSSLVTGRLGDGFPLDIISNSGAGFDKVGSFAISGTLLALFIIFLLNAFFTGGFYSAVKTGEFTNSRSFFGDAALFFRKFFGINLLTVAVLFFLALLLVAVPSAIGYSTMGNIIIFISLAVYSIAAVMVISVADFSRSMIVSDGKSGIISAVGKGIKSLSSGFLINISAIILILIIQVLIAYLFVIFIVHPVNSPLGGFLLFAGGHLFNVIKVFIRCWRYGTVTSLSGNRIPVV